MAVGKKTGGRQKGSKNKTTREREEFAREAAAAAQKAGETPLEYMLRVMRDDAAPTARRDAMAVAAAAYVHPRLATVEHSGEMTLNHEQALDELERKANGVAQPGMQH